jgi:hypothetical protein
MRNIRLAGCCLLATTLVATSVLAEDYDFEVDLSFDSSQFDGSRTTTTNGGTIFNSGKTDTDDLSVLGSWFFAGLSDDKGPRAQAAFVDRASSLSFGYTSSDQKTSTLLNSTDPSFPFPSIDSTISADSDMFSADFRYVDRDSGWFGTAGLLSSDTTLSGFGNGSVDATGWKLGGGKYLFETTSVGLEVAQVDVDDGADSTLVALSFMHLGDLGEQWQYAVDLGYSRTDSDGGVDLDRIGAAIAFYPTRDFEFGLAIEDVSSDSSSSIGLDTTRVEGFASWFVNQNVRLSARYGVADADFAGNVLIGGAPTVSDADQDSVGISATVRF